jgi:hypothetical protein
MAECIGDVNLFQPTGFQVSIDRNKLPNIAFFAQQVMHPGMQTNPADYSVPRLQAFPMPADTITFGELNIMGVLDEDFKSYKEMYNWMLELVNSKYRPASGRTADDTPSHCDVVVVALTSSNNPNITIRYKDCVPVSLGDITFDASSSDVPVVVVPVTFKFSHFVFE